MFFAFDKHNGKWRDVIIKSVGPIQRPKWKHREAHEEEIMDQVIDLLRTGRIVAEDEAGPVAIRAFAISKVKMTMEDYHENEVKVKGEVKWNCRHQLQVGGVVLHDILDDFNDQEVEIIIRPVVK